MKDNKLIAEFMGLYDEISLDSIAGNIHSWSDAPFFYITEDSKEKVMEGITKYSKYHTEWNWLMPVVQKCRLDGQNLVGIDNWSEIGSALEECNLDKIYQAVVEYIKEYNDGCHQTYNDER